MPSFLKFLTRPIAIICFSVIATGRLSADWRDEIGYTRLLLLAGSELPGVPSQGFTQVEAFDSLSNFLPDISSSLFTGKTFTLQSGSSGISGHANGVATNFYGNTTSLGTGNCPIDLYSASGWIYADFLNLGSLSQPAVESHAVANLSWIATGITEADATEINQRLDYAINRDGFVCAVAVNNGNSTTLPQLPAQSYHTISVGLVNGNHSAGFTTFDVAGRIKPDIVAPDGATSYATPMVASAAGLLYAKLPTSPALSTPDKPRVIKALLLATATKDTVASWSNTPSRPLDLRYGAGELNVNHAYHALRAGRATASSSTLANPRGWAADAVAGNSTTSYFFTIAPGAPSTPFSAALTWHRLITDNLHGPSWGSLSSSLADLNLRLYHASGFTLGSLVSESLSSVDNVELVYQSALTPGTYALVVQNASATSTPYALAWHSLPAVTVVATQPTAREIDGQAGLITISRTGDTTLPLFVPLTVSGSAVAGSHFQALPASVTIAAGQATTTLPVTPIADALAQGDRTVSVAVAADFALVRNTTQTAIVTIQDKPFDGWRFAHFTASELANPAISGGNSDADGDQLVNLIEYALGLDPKVPSLSPVSISQSGGYLTLAAIKNTAATDILWAAEVTDDLVTWQPAVVITQTSNAFTARDSIPSANSARRFIRLKITRP